MAGDTSVSLTYIKSTKGTHVYANADAGLSLYFPKELPIFAGSGEPPKVIKLTLTVGK